MAVLRCAAQGSDERGTVQTSIIDGGRPIERADATESSSETAISTVSSGDMRISPADELLLAVLRENARASTAEIARRLGLSRTTVQNRIERLERQGVIGGYTVRVHDDYERSRIRAHILITLRPKQMALVVKSLQAMHEVRELHSVSGEHDLVALAVAATVGDMDVLTDRIGAIDGVERTTTSIILSTKFER
jgi:DNA-binding Lrp family transcriptional regulator